MGCDIHCFAEKKQENKWIMIQDSFEHEDYKGEKRWDNEVYDGRNYELFSFLADVRNYEREVKPLSEPKGVPDDSSHGYLNEVEQYGSDGHSHSYFTLEELKNIPISLMNQEVDDNSLITNKDEDGNITEICASTTGEHFGRVGKRQLFKLFKDQKNPVEEIIKSLESVKEYEKDNEIRIVFFFDN